MTKIITVGLGGEASSSEGQQSRAYAIHVGDGLLQRAGELIGNFARGPVPVVTDSVVAEIHLARFLDILRKAGLDARPIVVPAGEGAKSFAGLENLCDALLETGI